MRVHTQLLATARAARRDGSGVTDDCEVDDRRGRTVGDEVDEGGGFEEPACTVAPAGETLVTDDGAAADVDDRLHVRR